MLRQPAGTASPSPRKRVVWIAPSPLPVPAAVADDGMLDLSLIRPVHFWHLLFRFHYLFNGGIYRIRHILQERGSRIRIESSPEVSVEIDGEPLGHTPLEFSILHRAIRIVVARDFYQRCAAVGAETPAG